MMILAVMVLPVSAAVSPQDVDTKAKIATGGGCAPIVLAKWEADTTGCLEDGDPTHAINGSQFLPPVTYDGKKTIKYYSIVYDEEENGNVNVVSWDIFQPNNCWGNGAFVYQVMGEKITNKAEAVALFQAAVDANLVEFDDEYDANLILTEYLEKGTAALWVGQSDLCYCSPAGDYRVEAFAVDHNNNWACALENTFCYVPVTAFDIDFCTVNYGSVNINEPKWIAGNTIFSENDGRPTVRNIGNTYMQVTVEQDDMQLGESLNGWNVKWGARMGNDDANAVYYDPEGCATLPNYLGLCGQDELDFSIEVYKGTTGEKCGTMTLGAEIWECCPA
ncbi:hypothetical protein [Methanoculleus sp.]|nr:hypothetical protein [Methanoculleus sp.]